MLYKKGTPWVLIQTSNRSVQVGAQSLFYGVDQHLKPLLVEVFISLRVIFCHGHLSNGTTKSLWKTEFSFKKLLLVSILQFK